MNRVETCLSRLLRLEGKVDANEVEIDNILLPLVRNLDAVCKFQSKKGLRKILLPLVTAAVSSV